MNETSSPNKNSKKFESMVRYTWYVWITIGISLTVIAAIYFFPGVLGYWEKHVMLFVDERHSKLAASIPSILLIFILTMAWWFMAKVIKKMSKRE